MSYSGEAYILTVWRQDSPDDVTVVYFILVALHCYNYENSYIFSRNYWVATKRTYGV